MQVRTSMRHLAATASRRLPPLSVDPTEYVDTLFGVGSATSAGPCLPAGSIHPSPETLEKDCGGYLRNQPIIGFGNAYVSGSGGTKCYGNYLLAPMLGAIEPEHARRASFAKPGTEKGRCFGYAVQLENGIGVRLAPAHNAAIYEFTYPAGEEASLLVDVAHKLDWDACLKEGSITVDPQTKTVYGGGLYCGNWNDNEWNMYFVLQLEGDCTRWDILQAEQLLPCTQKTTVAIHSLQRLGAVAGFGGAGQTVRAKLAISFESVEKATAFLQQQIPAFDLEAVGANAREQWRQVLGVIELGTKDPDLLRRFYTAMYHMNLQPRNRVSDHGYWDDFHTVWDSWKTVFPMYALLYPDKLGAIVDSMLDRAQANWQAGTGIVLGDEFMNATETAAGQGGNDVDNVLVDAYLKGICLTRHTWQEAYAVLLRSASQMRSPEYVQNGRATENAVTVSGVPYTWRFKPAAATMGFAFNDRAIAAMSAELGTPEEQKYFLARGKNWHHVWNPDAVSEGFRGFPQNRNAHGDFDPDFDPHGGYNSHFYEATAWDAAYIVYNDVPGLVEAMGGVHPPFALGLRP